MLCLFQFYTYNDTEASHLSRHFWKCWATPECIPFRPFLLMVKQFLHVYICHRHEIRDKEKTMWFGCSDSNWGFQGWCWQICRWIMVFPLCMCCGFPTEIVEQMIVMSSNDVTVISCAIGGGKYIRKACSCHRAVVWVFWHWMVGPFVKSLTLYSSYISASCGARVYPGWIVYLAYSCACTQTFWEHLS